jgi:hypothetical protein
MCDVGYVLDFAWLSFVQKKIKKLKCVGLYDDGFCAGIWIIAFVQAK